MRPSEVLKGAHWCEMQRGPVEGTELKTGYIIVKKRGSKEVEHKPSILLGLSVILSCDEWEGVTWVGA